MQKSKTNTVNLCKENSAHKILKKNYTQNMDWKMIKIYGNTIVSPQTESCHVSFFLFTAIQEQ